MSDDVWQRAAGLRALLTPERMRGLWLVMRFGITGTLGFLLDTAIVYSVRRAVGLYAAGMVSYLLAATFTWTMNRNWTFRNRARRHAGKQWATFMAGNMLGLVLNRGAYFILVATSLLCRQHPILAVAGGAIAGMGANFTVAHRLVFK